MKTCPNCQNPVNDGELFCPNCGTRIAVQPNPDIDSKSNAQQPYGEPPFYTEQTNFAQNNNYYTVPQTGWGINTTPYLIWSILNIIFCCLPLSIWSLVLVCNANKKPTYEQAQKDIKTAKIVCLAATIGGGIFQLFYVLLSLITWSNM